MAQALADTVDALVRPMAEAAGLDLVDVEVKGTAPRVRIRVVVDRKGGVDLATCQAISRELSRALDDQDPVDGRYTLEVTSPGTDWPLGDQRAFDRVQGRTVRAVVDDGDDVTHEVVGTVEEAQPDAVVIRDDGGQSHTVPYARLVRATQVLPW